MGDVIDFPVNEGSEGKPGGANRYLAVLTIELRQDSLENAVAAADLCRRFAYEATSRISVPRISVAGVALEPATDFPEVAFAVSTLSGINVSVLSPLKPAAAIEAFLRWARTLDPNLEASGDPQAVTLSLAPSGLAAAAQVAAADFREVETFAINMDIVPSVPVTALNAALRWFRASGYRAIGVDYDSVQAITAAIEAAAVDVVAELASVPDAPEAQ
jgi:hypothetical protein